MGILASLVSSSFIYFIGLRYPFLEVTVALAFIKEVVHPQGIPCSIVSDCDECS